MTRKGETSREGGALTGAFVLAHRELLKERYGPAKLGAALGMLGADARAEIEHATGNSWIAVQTIGTFYEAMARVLGRDVAELHQEIGALAAERMIRTLWRVILRLTSDSFVISQVSVFYAKTWSRGTLAARMLGARRAEMRLEGWPDVPEFVVRGVKIATSVTLRLTGRVEARTTAERTPDGARFDIEWT